jgi:PAS domain-containing protein
MEARWLTWGRSGFAVGVVVVLVVLGLQNMALRPRWQEVEDGVNWAARVEGVTAVEVLRDSSGEAAGIRPGDILEAVNGSPVRTPADVVEHQHRASEGTRLSYLLLRLGSREALEVTLAPAPRGSSMYFVLACVGLFTLVVGAAVRVRRPRDPATLHFFWLCVAFFGAFTFSFNGPLDRLDWVFYWGDAVAQALLPPLLLHFMLVFPERPASVRGSPESPRLRSQLVVPLLYLPALALGTVRILALTRGTANGPLFSQVLSLLDRMQLAYLFVSVVVALIVLVRTFRELTSPTARRQMRWIAWGTVFGVAPFAFGYALPWALGIDPPLALQFTAIPLGLVPLTFACALVRYRLRDIEVIVKRGLIYAVFIAASIAVYFGMRNLSGYFFPDDSDPRNWIVAVLATAVVVLLTQPVRESLRNALDRLFYRDRYDYRRALVGFARDLNTDLDVVRLSQRLVSRIVETLVIDRMALLLADERSHDFGSIGDFGFSHPVPKLQRNSSFLARLDAGYTVALDDPIATARFEVEEVELWRDAGIYGLVPCVFEDRAIAVLALGHKGADQPFNSEDLALLTAVAGQAATAIENGRLFRQLHLKAEELDGLREFNENILESLDDGLVVFDAAERIVRWNRALESFYGVARSEAIGRTLGDVFEATFVEALRADRRENPDGSRESDRWDAFIRRMWREGVLTKVDYDYVQAVWDLNESLKPDAQRVFRDLYGYFFAEITAVPFETPFGTYRGGYVPAIVDPFIATDAALRGDRAAMEETPNSFMFPSTGRGFTKGRVEPYARPLALDLRHVPAHLDAVLRFIHLQPAVRDAGRLVIHRGFRKTLDTFDPAVGGELLMPWLQRAAKQSLDTPAQGWGGRGMDRFWRGLRRRTGMQIMVANVVNALQQVTGLSVSALKVPPRALGRALWRYVRGPAVLTTLITDKSVFMQTRTLTQTIEVQQHIDDLLLNPSTYEQARAFGAKHGYFLSAATQNIVDVITWSGAYDHAVSEGRTEPEAVQQADAAVRLTQGSFNPEDLSAFETGSPMKRAFTMFYSYFGMLSNTLGSEFAVVMREMGLRQGAGRLLYVYSFGFVIPAVLSELLIQAMSGQPWDEDDDGAVLDDLLGLFFGAQRRTATAMLPGIGPALNIALNGFNDNWYDDRISVSPAVNAIENAGHAPAAVYRAITEGTVRRKDVRDVLTLVGLLTGVPAGAAARPLGYLADVAEGEIEPTGPVDVARGLVTGR